MISKDLKYIKNNKNKNFFLRNQHLFVIHTPQPATHTHTHPAHTHLGRWISRKY